MNWPDFFTLLAQIIIAIVLLTFPLSLATYLVSSCWQGAKDSRAAKTTRNL